LNLKEQSGKRPSFLKMESSKIFGDLMQLNKKNQCSSQILNALEMKPA
jgi:hypothetical protein